MIFTKRIDQITYEDVLNFCGRNIQENFVLDYKADFPKDLPRTIAALANTYGGVILLGVGDADGKPIPNPIGIPFRRGMSEQVTQLVLEYIYPPVFPEVQVCPDTTEANAFVVIRVPESEETPHTLLGRKQIFVRTQNITKPYGLEDIATLDQIEWLQARRKRSVDLRERLVAAAENRATNYIASSGIGETYGLATFVVGPRYPARILNSPLGIMELMGKQLGTTYDGSEFPKGRHTAEPVQGGVAAYTFTEHSKWFSYAELNEYGLFIYKEDMGRTDHEGDEKIEKIYLFELVTRIDLILNYVAGLYPAIGFNGLVDFRLSLSNVLGRSFIALGDEMWQHFNKIRRIIDRDIIWSTTFSVPEISDTQKRKELLLALAADVAWAFGVPNHRSFIEKFLREHRRLPAASE
jgi:hypothetical protein